MTFLRLTLRSLRRAPVFALTVVLTLALGIGGVTATFSALRTLLLEPLPYPSPELLVALHTTRPDGARQRVSLLDLNDWRRASQSFTAMAAYRSRTFGLDMGDGAPIVIRTVQATAELFDVLGVPPSTGRTWTSAETEDAVAVVTGPLWRRLFGAASFEDDATVVLNEVPHTVLGVLDDSFTFPVTGPQPEVFLPLSQRTYGQKRDLRTLAAIARRAPGRDDARRELETITGRLAAAHPGTNDGWSAGFEDLHEALYGGNRRPLLLLLAAAFLVLAIGGSNVANLFVTRFLTRRAEVTVRLALGAPLGAVGRLFLAEATILCVLGAAAGLLLAGFVLDVLPAVLELYGGSVGVALGLDHGAFACALALALATALVFALVPILMARGLELTPGLRNEAPAHRRIETGLVVGQIALSMLLLLAAGLLTKSFYAVLKTPPGFSTSGVLAFGLGLPESRYDERGIVDFHGRLLDRLAEIDGVEAVGAGARRPLGRVFTTRFRLADQPPPEEAPRAAINVVSPGFLEALDIPLVAGRNFNRGNFNRDRPDTPRAVLVNRAFQRTWLSDGADVLGRRLVLSWWSALHPRESEWEIVGVIGDTRLRSLEENPEPAVYLALSQFPAEGVTYLLRAERPDTGLTLHSAVRAAVAELDPDLAEPVLSKLDEHVAGTLSERRFGLGLAGVFAALALALTAVGIYAQAAMSVARRRREMAVRLALGARYREVRALVLRHGLGLALRGIALGTVAFALLSRLIESRLYGTSALDPPTLAVVAVGMCGVAAVAAGTAGHRLRRLAPADVLRDE